MDAPHVFTEPLDYLLNLDGDFAVLNFGVSGYGPAQSYFAYRSFHGRKDLDLRAVRLLRQQRHQRPRPQQVVAISTTAAGCASAKRAGRPRWVPIASRLHLTYLALDAADRLESYVLGRSEDLQTDRDTWAFRDLALTDHLWDYGP